MDGNRHDDEDDEDNDGVRDDDGDADADYDGAQQLAWTSMSCAFPR